MLKDKKCIDFHAHPVTDSFRKAMVDLGIDPIEEDGFPLPKWSAEEHLAFMEEAGIDYSVLSAPVPHIYNGDASKARKAAREINDGVAETVRRRSDRFGFVGLVPLPDVDGALAETDYVLDELGAAGVKVATNMGGRLSWEPDLRSGYGGMESEKSAGYYPSLPGAAAAGTCDYRNGRGDI